MIRGNVAPESILEMNRGSDLEEIEGTSHTLIPHALAFKELMRCADKFDWEIEKTHCAISKDILRLNSLIAIEFTCKSLPKIDKARYSFAILNGNDRHTAMRFYGGLSAATFKAGVVLSDPEVKTRHTINADLQTTICMAMDVFNFEAASYKQEVAQLRKVKLKESDVQSLLFAAGRDKLMPWSRIGKIDSLYWSKSCENLWQLLLCYGRIAQHNPPIQQCRQMFGFYSLVRKKLDVSNAA